MSYSHITYYSKTGYHSKTAQRGRKQYDAKSIINAALFSGVVVTAGALLTGNAFAAAQRELLVYAPTNESTTTNELAKYGSKLEVITRQQIDHAGPNADVTRILQMYVPGFYVAPKAGPFDYGTYSLLGGKPEDTLVLIDGVRLNNRLYNGIYIDTLPVTAIERIEIVKGPQSLLFGTQAVSGVVNIVTKTPRSQQLSGKVNLGIDSLAGTDTDASVGKVQDNALGHFSWLVWAGKNRSSGYQTFRNEDIDPLMTQRKRRYDLNIAGLKLSQTFSDKARLSLFWQYAQGRFDTTGANELNRVNRNDRVQNIGTITFDHYLTDYFSYVIKGHLHQWDSRYTQILNTPANGVEVKYDKTYWGFSDYGLQLAGKFTTSNDSEWVFGVDNQWYSSLDKVFPIDKNTTAASAFYLQGRPKFTSIPDWYPSAGVRYEKIHGGGGALVWMVSSRYALTPDLQLRGQIGTAYKLPVAEQLYAKEPDEIGNPQLKPEKTRNIEAGFDYQPGWLNERLQLSAGYYHRHIYDMQLLDNSTNTFINAPGEVAVQGFEVNGTLQVNPQWQIAADMTRNYLNSHYTTTNVPYFFSRARLNYHAASQRWGGQLAVRYVDKIVSRGVNYGNYAVWDAELWLHLDNALHHKVTLSVDNVFNRHYATAIATNTRREKIDLLGRPLVAELRYSWNF